MKAIVVGCGRTGSAIALQLSTEGEGGFVLGHALDDVVLRRAGIEGADAVAVATDGDNTNIVVGQVAQMRYGIGCVVVRVLDPARAAVFSPPRPPAPVAP